MLDNSETVPFMRPMYIPRGTDGKQGIISVDAENDGVVHFFPAGGGFEHRLPEAEFLEKFEPLKAERYYELLNDFEQINVWGDWFDDKPAIPAWSNGYVWNGWQCPVFEKAHADAAVADGRIAYVQYIDALDAYMYVDTQGEKVTFDFAAEAAKMEGEQIREITIDGMDFAIELFRAEQIVTKDGPVKVYGIGAGSWCWERAPEPEVSPPAL